MKIGIDISQIVYEGTGVSRFTNGLVNTILDLDRSNSWLFFFSSLRKNLDSILEEKIKGRGYKLLKWRIPPTLLSFLFNDLHSFSKSFMFHVSCFTSLDWFITSDWTEPPLPVKKATIVHDLAFLRYPETVDSKILATQKKRLSWVKKESKIIFADSQTTKDDLINILNFDQKKIFLNYPGVEIEIPSRQDIAKTLKKYNLHKPFILTVSKLEPRKNIKRLIETFIKLDNSKLDLVIVGSKGWGEDISIKHLIEIKGKVIRFLDYVDDLSLCSLYSSCLFFIYPSIWEGFGYPVVEAMKLGAPVTTSNTSSLNEIAKGAALFFDPFNVNEMYQCIDTLIHDKDLRDELSKKGMERSKIYTWRRYYQTLIEILKKNS